MGSHGGSRSGSSGGGGASKMTLPKLSGSEKQVKWANSIRQNYVDTISKESQRMD